MGLKHEKLHYSTTLKRQIHLEEDLREAHISVLASGFSYFLFLLCDYHIGSSALLVLPVGFCTVIMLPLILNNQPHISHSKDESVLWSEFLFYHCFICTSKCFHASTHCVKLHKKYCELTLHVCSQTSHLCPFICHIFGCWNSC